MAHPRNTFNFNPGYHFFFFFFPLQQIVDFLGDSVVRNPPANAGDMGSVPALGRLHMLWGS